MDIHASNEEINNKVAEITAKTVAILKTEQDRLGIKSYSGKGKKINVRYTEKNGLVNRISFKFSRYMVFIEKGASKSHGGTKGSQWKNRHGQVIKTNPKSLGKMNTGKRHAKEWFNPVIENYAQQLAIEVAHEFVQLSFKNLRIK